MNQVANLMRTCDSDMPILLMVGDLQQFEREIRAAERERLAHILERRRSTPQGWIEIADAVRRMVES